MDELIDENITTFGTNPLLTFGQKYLLIEHNRAFGRKDKKNIPLKNIQSLSYEKTNWWRRFTSIIFVLTFQGSHDFRSHLEIAYTIDGEKALTSCIGKFDEKEIGEMQRLIHLRETNSD